jgi:hypothetical protein
VLDTILSRRNIAIVIVAIILALGILLLRPNDAAAQFSDDGAMDVLTIERLMILGMLGLVVLTWFYLKWRPPVEEDDDPQTDPEQERP